MLFNGVLGCIPEIENITSVLENYSFYSPENATSAIKENATSLVYGFLIDGIANKDNETVFPGVLNVTISYGFDRVKQAITEAIENLSRHLMGEALGSLDNLFVNISGAINPLATAILDNLTMSIQDLVGVPVDSLNDALDKLEVTVKENASRIVGGFLDEYIEYFVDSVFILIEQSFDDIYTLVKDVKGLLSTWLFERISLNKAEVVLTVWEVRG